MVTFSGWRASLTIAGLLLGLAGLLWHPALVAAEADEAHESLSAYISSKGTASDIGWRTAAIQVEDERFLVVQLGEAGDIYQLGNFDGMYITGLNWKDDALLEVDWQSPDGRRWHSRVQLDRTGNASDFDVVYVRQRTGKSSSNSDVVHTGQRKGGSFGPLPDMVDRADIGTGTFPLTPALDRPGVGR